MLRKIYGSAAPLRESGEPTINGFLNILKPPGMTSHDVVAYLRKLLGIRRVGHTGTLDPQAAGVLPICLGQATRLASLVSGQTKSYRAEVTFGIETDTLDAEGKVVGRRDASQLTEHDLRQVLPKFLGEIEQKPPMFSAVRHEGKHLYELARKGDRVERKPRRVTIEQLELLRFQPGEHPRALIDVTCSSGTYVRSLAADLGSATGWGAYLSFLIRTRAGGFHLQDSIALEELGKERRMERVVLPLDFPLSNLPEMTADSEQAKRIAHGNPIPGQGETSGLVRVYDPSGRLLAIANASRDRGQTLLRPKIVFASDEETEIE